MLENFVVKNADENVLIIDYAPTPGNGENNAASQPRQKVLLALFFTLLCIAVAAFLVKKQKNKPVHEQAARKEQ